VVDQTYVAEASSGRLAVDLDSLTTLYHRRSGVTHVVAEPVPQIMAALSGQSLNVEGLIVVLAQDHDLSDTQETRAALVARLDELVEVGLVSHG
jgi:PqqD family protein of HPr-rel-A system